MQLGEQERRFQLLIRDRDTKFSRAFDEIFRSDGIDVIRTPLQAPNATRSLSAACAPSAATASIAFSFSDADISNECCACTRGTTTSTGRTVPSNSPRQTASTQSLTSTGAPRLPSAAPSSSAD
jgi:hypothetical protein